MAKALVKKGLTRVTKLEFDLLSHEEGWWEGKLDEVRESGMIGLEGGRWTNAGAVGWIRGDAGRNAEYELALKDFAHKIALECLAITDNVEMGIERTTRADGSVETKESDMLGHRKLKADMRMKLASKWDKGRYGEHVNVEVVHNLADRLIAARERVLLGVSRVVSEVEG